MPRRNRDRSQLGAIDQINMTPLLDLTFLLLIIFMITAPMLEYAIDVSPPEMNATKLPDENNKFVSLTSKGEIVFDKVVVSEETLARDLANLFQLNPKTNILVRADGVRQYNEVVKLLKIVKDAGFSSVSLVTQVEAKE